MIITIGISDEALFNEHEIDDFADWIDWDKIENWCDERGIKVQTSSRGLFGEGEKDCDYKVWGRGISVYSDNDYEDIRGALYDVQMLRDQLIDNANREVAKVASQED